jgi:uncharacterized OB-fold protein
VNQQRPFTDRSYAAFLSEEQLMGSRCHDCKQLFIPPRGLCPDCHTENLSWEQVGGRGRLVALTRMAMVSPALAEEGYGKARPYCSGVIELDEGFGQEMIGQAMQVGFEHLDRKTPRLVFRPV